MTIEPKKTEFRPVTVEVTFESQAEVDCMAAILNLSHICDYARGEGASSIYNLSNHLYLNHSADSSVVRLADHLRRNLVR